MRQAGHTQHAMFSYRTLEERILSAHPLRKLRVLADGILRSAAPTMSRRSINKPGAALGGDKGYDDAELVNDLRDLKISPHVAQKKNSAIDGRTTRHAGYAVSLKKRKLVEEIFGWSKTVGGLCKARVIGLAKVRVPFCVFRRT